MIKSNFHVCQQKFQSKRFCPDGTADEINNDTKNRVLVNSAPDQNRIGGGALMRTNEMYSSHTHINTLQNTAGNWGGCDYTPNSPTPISTRKVNHDTSQCGGILSAHGELSH